MSDSEAYFKGIYTDNHDKVMRLCLGYAGGDVQMASDLTQEVFIKVWKNLKTFRAESQMTTWIYRIAVNTCLMNLRHKKYQSSQSFVAAVSDDDTAEMERNKERQYQKMYQCIDKLTPMNKAIIVMELEGLPQKEIAQVTGLKHEAVRTRIFRIKNQLTKCVHHERI